MGKLGCGIGGLAYSASVTISSDETLVHVDGFRMDFGKTTVIKVTGVPSQASSFTSGCIIFPANAPARDMRLPA